MKKVASRDGTIIAYDRQGSGKPVILVAGALCSRLSWSGPELSALLSPSFAVFNYDRRGRGDSGDTSPYAVEREIEDLEALIDLGGGRACLYGHSSGASLCLEAAATLGDKVERLALYEAPYNDDPAAQAAWSAYVAELGRLLAAKKKGEAVAAFMKYLGTPEAEIEGMRHAPMWAGLERLAPTLDYDHRAILGPKAAVPVERAAMVKARALVMNGGESYPFMLATALALSEAIPHARHLTLGGQRHDVSTKALAPLLAEFFTGA